MDVILLMMMTLAWAPEKMVGVNITEHVIDGVGGTMEIIMFLKKCVKGIYRMQLFSFNTLYKNQYVNTVRYIFPYIKIIT